ncbi:MAG: hypothetical protein JSW05_01545 [Candidatus Thorarchaeota archaeon]|nr:MAG: hypothetical protein JSW05_01545 [Candidatus Thorarchaeota archaeon]
MPKIGSTRIGDGIEVERDVQATTLWTYINASFGLVSMALVLIPVFLIPGYIIIALCAEVYLADWIYYQLTGKVAQITIDAHVAQEHLDTLREINIERTAVDSVVHRQYAR